MLLANIFYIVVLIYVFINILYLHKSKNTFENQFLFYCLLFINGKGMCLVYRETKAVSKYYKKMVQ